MNLYTLLENSLNPYTVVVKIKYRGEEEERSVSLKSEDIKNNIVTNNVISSIKNLSSKAGVSLSDIAQDLLYFEIKDLKGNSFQIRKQVVQEPNQAGITKLEAAIKTEKGVENVVITDTVEKGKDNKIDMDALRNVFNKYLSLVGLI